MRCKEVKNGLVAYLDGEVMPSERTLIEAHLAGCAPCERELSALGSSRRQVAESLKTMAAQAAPSPQALTRLQARLAEEVRTLPQARSHLQGDGKMKLRWRIALGTVSAIVIAAGVIAVVPSTRAAAGNFFAGVFNIDSNHPVKLGYLPAGFEAKPLYVTGSATAGQGETPERQEQALYQNGDTFLSVKTSSVAGEALPSGEAAVVNGLAAVLQTGLSGSLDGPEMPKLKEGAEVTSGGSGEPGSGSEPSVRVQSGSAGAQVVVGGDSQQGSGPAQLPAITYNNANALTWIVDGTRVELLTNLPVDELLKIAQGVALSK